MDIATGVTVTINGPMEAGPYQIFNCVGTGKVIFDAGSVVEVYPQWHGAKGDGTTDDLAAVKSAIASLGSSGNGTKKLTFPFTGFGYKISDQVEITRGNLWLDFHDNVTSTNIDPNNMFYIHGSNGNELQNIKITGSKIILDGNGDNVTGYTYRVGGPYCDVMLLA